MFATELTLRRAPSNRVNVSIKPGSARNEGQKEKLAEFKESFITPDKFPTIIQAAKDCMRDASQENDQAFFNDILRVEITRPDVLPLTIVDLPGIIHVSDKEESKDHEVVNNLIESYMANERCIILAVISANANRNLQKVIGLLRRRDSGVNRINRTLGIVTKLDTLHDGSELQRNYLAIARNQVIVLKHRWHALRNREFPSRDSSAEERDSVERAFFDSGVWKSLDRADVGVDALRRKLSTILLQQIRRELPSLAAAISSQIDECKSELRQLGEPRSDIADQKIYLTGIVEAYQKLATFAVSGLYECDPFFRDSSPEDKFRKNLRALLQLFNEEFSDVMHNKGHAWEHPNYEPQRAASGPFNQLDDMVEQPPVRSFREFVEDMRHTMLYERRCEPIGVVHPSHIGTLLQSHSKPWRAIAEKHLTRTWEAVKSFLECVLSHLADKTTYANLMAEKIYPILDKKWIELMAKLDELLFPTHCHPLIYAPEYIEFARSEFGVNFEDNTEAVPTDPTGRVQTAPQVFSSGEQYYDYLYRIMIKQYNTMRSHFIDNVACLAVEKCLISPLPLMLSGGAVVGKDEETVRRIATEPKEVSDRRSSLQQRLDVLTGALNNIRRQAILSPEAIPTPEKPSQYQNTLHSNATQVSPLAATRHPLYFNAIPSDNIPNGSNDVGEEL